MNKSQLLADLKSQISTIDIAIHHLTKLNTPLLTTNNKNRLTIALDYIVAKQNYLKSICNKLYLTNDLSLAENLHHQATGIEVTTRHLASISADINDNNISKNLDMINDYLISAKDAIKYISLQLSQDELVDTFGQ